MTTTSFAVSIIPGLIGTKVSFLVLLLGILAALYVVIGMRRSAASQPATQTLRSQ